MLPNIRNLNYSLNLKNKILDDIKSSKLIIICMKKLSGRCDSREVYLDILRHEIDHIN